MPVELPYGVIKCDPRHAIAAMLCEPIQNFTFAPSGDIFVVDVLGRRRLTYNPRRDIGRKPGPKLVQRVVMTPHGTDDDFDSGKIAQERFQTRQMTKYPIGRRRLALVLGMEHTIEIKE